MFGYLNKGKTEIERENKINNISYDIKDFEKYRTKISRMNIDEFVEFLLIQKN